MFFQQLQQHILDAYSAGVSSETIFSKINGKYMAIAVTIVGTIAAIIYPMDDITDFFINRFSICTYDCNSNCRLLHYQKQ